MATKRATKAQGDFPDILYVEKDDSDGPASIYWQAEADIAGHDDGPVAVYKFVEIKRKATTHILVDND